jgi:hypothetical protein
MPEIETAEAPSFDVEAAADSIGNDLFPSEEVESEPEQESTEAAPVEASTQPAPTETPVVKPETETPAPTVRPAPKSWAKETHEVWAKLDPQAQDYIEKREKDFLSGLDQYKHEATYGKTLRDVIAPFQPMLQASGVDGPQAVAFLLNAHAQLSQGSMESRRAAYEQLGRNLKLTPEDPNAAPVDPKVRQLEERLASFEQSVTARQQAELTAARDKAGRDLEAFVTEHPDFDEVGDEVLKLVQVGESLQDAYDKAKWMNKVTRQKEIVRLQTEAEAKLRENARLDALPKQKAAGVNVRGRDTKRGPTDPLGTMDDTMAATLAEIKSRSH